MVVGVGSLGAELIQAVVGVLEVRTLSREQRSPRSVGRSWVWATPGLLGLG